MPPKGDKKGDKKGEKKSGSKTKVKVPVTLDSFFETAARDFKPRDGFDYEGNPFRPKGLTVGAKLDASDPFAAHLAAKKFMALCDQTGLCNDIAYKCSIRGTKSFDRHIKTKAYKQMRVRLVKKRQRKDALNYAVRLMLFRRNRFIR